MLPGMILGLAFTFTALQYFWKLPEKYQTFMLRHDLLVDLIYDLFIGYATISVSGTVTGLIAGVTSGVAFPLVLKVIKTYRDIK